MNLPSQFAYSQARLHARHGMRPDEQAWRELETQQLLANFLQNARRSSLRPWVLNMHANDDWHQLEENLLRQVLDYIDVVASFQPPAWRAAVRWVKQLLLLPTMHYLLAGEAVPEWMCRAPWLKAFASVEMSQRLAALRDTENRPLVEAWQQNTPLLQAWQQHWQSRWPSHAPGVAQPLTELSQLLATHQSTFAQQSAHPWQAREKLADKLTSLFRRYPRQPVAVFIHLALVALDMERLRGNILQRAIFPELHGARP